MLKPRVLPLICLLAGSSLLQGCLTTPAEDTAPATPVVAPATEAAKAPIAAPEPKAIAKASPKPADAAKPTVKRVASAKPVAKTTSAAPKPTVHKVAAVTSKGVKPIKPGSKPGQKLTPEEVEDLIRQLSVCRPS